MPVMLKYEAMYWTLPIFIVLLFAVLRIIFRSQPTRISGNFLIWTVGLELLILFTGHYVYLADIFVCTLVFFFMLFIFLLATSRNVLYVARIDDEALTKATEDALQMLLISFISVKKGYRLTGSDGATVDIDCYTTRYVGILGLRKNTSWKKARLLRKLLTKKFDGIMPHITIHSS